MFPGYILIGTEDLATMVTTLVEYKTEIVNLFAIAYYSNLSLYSTDGKVIVNGAEKILFPNKKNLKDNHIVYEKRNARIIQKGGLLLDNLSDSVPCLFSDISYHYPKDSSEKAYWSIKRSKIVTMKFTIKIEITMSCTETKVKNFSKKVIMKE